jgi:hypothetical protein
MKIVRTGFVLTAALFLAVSAFGYFFWYKPNASMRMLHKKITPIKTSIKPATEALITLKQKIQPAKIYVTAHGLNTQYCFLVDMHIPSGKNRFFVCNFKTDSIEKAGLVTHGSGSANATEDLFFSNVPNSFCTSTGHYKVGKSYSGNFGLAYKLHGLDKTNDKAFNRFVVLHGHECVPDREVWPALICESWGCPTVSPVFLKQLQLYLNGASKPIMLWIYY